MIVGGKTKLREKRLADAPDDYAWQTDAELAQLDAVSLPTITFQQHWLDNLIPYVLFLECSLI